MLKVFSQHKGWFIFVALLVLGYGLFLVLVSLPIASFSIEKAAQLGDSFGILNSLFTGLAFIALVITIYIQQQDVKNNKEEIQKQNFENTYFNLIKIHNDLVANFRQIHFMEKDKKHIMYGGEAISFFLTNYKKGGFTGFYTSNKNFTKDENYKDAFKKRNIDENTCKINLNIKLMGNNLKFIENVYSILRLIDKKINLAEEDKFFYIDTLLAQISDEELVLIFYYTHGIKAKMKSLIEEYSFFENLDTQLLHNWQEEVKLYDKKAYGDGTTTLSSGYYHQKGKK